MLTMEEFIQACRERGLNVTYQRMLIYRVLSQNRNHPSAEEIYHQVRQEYPAISLATVYKTLETFAEHNLITKVTQLHDQARFDGETRPHHHLLCVHCKRIVDIYDEQLNGLEIPESCRQRFQILGYRIQFEGICPECATRQSC